MNRRWLAAPFLLSLGLAALPVTAAEVDAPALAAGIDRAGGDPAVRAQDDFFRNVNGAWLRTTTIAPDKAYAGSFDTIHDRIQVALRDLVESAARSRD
ncbi:MAG: M13 family peptidase, partial [Caldimonas sp.]